MWVNIRGVSYFCAKCFLCYEDKQKRDEEESYRFGFGTFSTLELKE